MAKRNVKDLLLSGKVAVATGASRGVGKGFACKCDHNKDAQVLEGEPEYTSNSTAPSGSRSV